MLGRRAAAGARCHPYFGTGRATPTVVTNLGGFGVWQPLGTAPVSLGWPSDAIAIGDYDGTGVVRPAVLRPPFAAGQTGTLLRYGAPATIIPAPVMPDARPVPGDYDGDGVTDLAYWNPADGTWHVSLSYGQWRPPVQWGLPGDVPVPGDYDGDGRTDFAVYRPSNGTWYLATSRAPWSAVQYGIDGDVPVPADYDGDWKTDIAVWRPSTGTWFLRNTGSPAQSFVLGKQGDVPVQARSR